MALSKAKTQWVAGGVVLGVLATMGVQFGMATVEKQANQKKVEQFVHGYKNASDKTAFVRNFDYSGSGVSVGVNTSSADDGVGRCVQLRDTKNALQAMMEANSDVLMKLWKDYGSPTPDTDEYSTGFASDSEYRALLDSRRTLNLEFMEAYEAWIKCVEESPLLE